MTAHQIHLEMARGLRASPWFLTIDLQALGSRFVPSLTLLVFVCWDSRSHLSLVKSPCRTCPLVVFFHDCGKTVRQSRVQPEHCEEIAGAWFDCFIDEMEVFTEADTGPDYLPRGSYGPPYAM